MIYRHIHIYVHLYIYKHIYHYAHWYIHLYMHTDPHTDTEMFMHIHTYIYTHICIHICVYTYHTLYICILLFSCSVMSYSLWPHGLQHARLPCLSPAARSCSNSCPLSWWCHPTISSSVIPFSSCLLSFPASGSFPINWLVSSGGQCIGASVLVYISINTYKYYM